MKVSREDKDALNAVIRVDVDQADYKDAVEKSLANIRKNANIPGFRKGMVPASVIRKQYGTMALAEEVNKVVNAAVDDYLRKEKLDIFGQPLPVPQNIDWEKGGDFSFQFEIGLIPQVKVKPEDAAKKVVSYRIKVSPEYIEDHIASLAKQFGKMTPMEQVEKASDVVVNIEARDKDGNLYQPGAYKEGMIIVADIKNAKNFIGKKVGDAVEVSPKDFKSATRLSQFLGKSADECQDFADTLVLTITRITNVEPHALDKELFERLYGPEAVADEAAFRQKIQEEAEAAFRTETDAQMMTDTIDYLIENTKFDLPTDFLRRWLMASAEKPMTDQEAEQQMKDSEKSLRYQLIETQLLLDAGVRIDYAMIQQRAKDLLRMQMAQYGQAGMPDEQLDPILERVLKNREEVGRIQNMLVREKLMDIFKEKVPYKVKEVTLDEFVKAVAAAKKK